MKRREEGGGGGHTGHCRIEYLLTWRLGRLEEGYVRERDLVLRYL